MACGSVKRVQGCYICNDSAACVVFYSKVISADNECAFPGV